MGNNKNSTSNSQETIKNGALLAASKKTAKTEILENSEVIRK